jgi:hypothetical protein
MRIILCEIQVAINKYKHKQKANKIKPLILIPFCWGMKFNNEDYDNKILNRWSAVGVPGSTGS